MKKRLFYICVVAYIAFSLCRDYLLVQTCMCPPTVVEGKQVSTKPVSMQELLRYVQMADDRLSGRYLSIQQMRIRKIGPADAPERQHAHLVFLFSSVEGGKSESIGYRLVDTEAPRFQDGELVIDLVDVKVRGPTFSWPTLTQK